MAARDDAEARAAQREREVADLTTQLSFLQEEITALYDGSWRSRPVRPESSKSVSMTAQANLAAVTGQNERLVATLKEARDQIVALKEEVDRLAQPPSGFGVFLAGTEDGTVDVFTGGRKLRVNVSPAIEVDALRRGQEVMLNEALNVVDALGFERLGEVVMLKEILEDGERALVISHADEERVVQLAESADRRSRSARRRLAAARAALRLRLRAHPQVRGRRARPGGGARHRLRATSAASCGRSSRSATPSSCRSCTPTCSGSTSSRRPRASCCTARPAAARRSSPRPSPTRWPRRSPRRPAEPRASSFFLNIKGPELLNKYVGETERHIRLVFQRAREKASRGHPGHRVLRRDGLDLPDPRLGRLLRRREHHRPAAAERDRRCRGAGERHRHRRLQPRGHDRPGDPAARPARREDQDRAAGRRGGQGHLLQVPHRRAAAAPRRPRRARRLAGGDRRGDDPARSSSGCTPRPRRTASSR